MRPHSWRDEERKKTLFYRDEVTDSSSSEDDGEDGKDLDAQTACLLQMTKTMANLGKEVRKGGDTSK